MLKSILDQTSFGQYDFMYLRIGKHMSFFRHALMLILTRLRQQLQVCLDNQSKPCFVANQYSVGYAFVNFEDVSRLPCLAFVHLADLSQPVAIIAVGTIPATICKC